MASGDFAGTWNNDAHRVGDPLGLRLTSAHRAACRMGRFEFGAFLEDDLDAASLSALAALAGAIIDAWADHRGRKKD